MLALRTLSEGAHTSLQETPLPDEIAALYEKYKRPLHTYISRLLGNREEADDVIQEVFLSAFVSWHNLTDRSRISAWLYRVATNLCMDQLRKRKRIAWWPLTQRPVNPQFEFHAEEEAPYLPTNNGGIPEIFEREHIHLALASLPEEYAAMLILNVAQGVSYIEIASLLGISSCAAATRLSRARRMFAQHYLRLSKG